MPLKTSLVIEGDAKGAVAAASQATDAVGKLDTAQRSASLSAVALTDANARLDTGASRAAAAMGALGDTQARVGATLTTSTRAHNDNAGAIERTREAASKASDVLGGAIKHIADGREPAEAFRDAASEAGDAVGELAAKSSLAQTAGTALGGVLGGVLGAAVGALTGLLVDEISEMLKGEQAMQALKLSADATATAQGALGAMFDLATGKLTKNTEALYLNATAQAINLRASAAQKRSSSDRAFDEAGEPTMMGRAIGFGAAVLGVSSGNQDMVRYGLQKTAGNEDVRKLREQWAEARNITDEAKRAAQEAKLMQQAYLTDFQGSGVTKQEFIQAIADRGSAAADVKASDDILASLKTGRLAGGLLRPKTERGGGRARSSGDNKSVDALAEFGRDAGATIARIRAEFDGTPPAVRQVNDQVAKLDDLIDDLARKKPPNFGSLIADAKAAKVAVQEGLSKPFDDFVKAQQRDFAVGQALLGGDQQRAQALQTIGALERQMGPLTEAQKQAVLDTVVALDAQARQLDVLHEKQQVYLDGLSSIKGIVNDATQAFAHGDLGEFIRSPGKLVQSFQSVQGQVLFEKLFGGAFRKLQDQVTGARTVEDASDRMAAAVGQVTSQTRITTGALSELAQAARGAAGAVDGAPQPGGGGGGSAPNIVTDPTGWAAAFTSSLGGGGKPNILTDPAGWASSLSGAIAGTGDVVVTGNRQRGVQSTAELFTKGIGSIGEKITGLFTSPEKAKLLGRSIGEYAGKGIEGAATGALVAGVGKSLGIKLNSTGSQIGGAIGNFLPIPGGSIIGSVLGGIVGSLFGSKPKPASSATLTLGANGQLGAGNVTGTSSELKAAASDFAGSIGKGIQQIADALGGTVQAVSGITVGTYKGDYRVNAVGGQLAPAKNGGDVNFHDDEAGAIAFAIQASLAKGAVAGLSTAVQRALGSSNDVDAALKEALKVQDVEVLLGGIKAQYDKAFRDFDAQAKDRLRIATQYGFDVVAIEKRNAEDRTKLAAQLLKNQVGSLQSLVDEITQGSLFEGSALDKVTALNASITKAKADLDAGVDGAADTLANLYGQRLSTLKDAYGTTSGYAGGRDDTLDQARAAIAAANAKITAAQGPASDPALVDVNSSLDENNDQNARIIAGIARTNELLDAKYGDGGIAGFNLQQLAAY